MNTQQIINKLAEQKAFLAKEFSVEEIAVFGSYARNENNSNSDLDLLVKLKEAKFKHLAGLYNYLEKILNLKVDITTKHAHLRERFLKSIEKDIIYV